MLIFLRYKRFLLCLIGFKLYVVYVVGKMFIIVDVFFRNLLVDKCFVEIGEYRKLGKGVGKVNLLFFICKKD